MLNVASGTLDSVTLRGTQLTALRGFNAVAASGLVLWENERLTQVTGFRSLRTAEPLSLYLDSALEDLSGLSGVEAVSGSLLVKWLPLLASLDGLSGVRWVDGDVEVRGNSALADVSGLHAVTGIDGDLTVAGNPLLGAAAAEALRDAIGVEHISGAVTIADNGE